MLGQSTALEIWDGVCGVLGVWIDLLTLVFGGAITYRIQINVMPILQGDICQFFFGKTLGFFVLLVIGFMKLGKNAWVFGRSKMADQKWLPQNGCKNG